MLDRKRGYPRKHRDDLLFLLCRLAFLSMIDRERTQYRINFRYYRYGPAREQAVLQGCVPVVRPKRVGLDVGHVNRVPAVGGRSARARGGADFLSLYRSDERFGKPRRHAEPKAAAVGVEEHDSSHRTAFAIPLYCLSELAQGLGQADVGGDLCKRVIFFLNER